MLVINKQEWSIYKALLWIAGVNLLQYLELRNESPQMDLENLQLLQIRRFSSLLTVACNRRLGNKQEREKNREI